MIHNILGLGNPIKLISMDMVTAFNLSGRQTKDLRFNKINYI